MNEEIEYAEMLEIPVSTVNVVRKNQRRKKQKALDAELQEPTPAPTQPPLSPLKETVIAQVNERLHDAPENEQLSIENLPMNEPLQEEGRLDFEPIPDRIDTVRVYSTEENSGDFDYRLHPQDYSLENENEGSRYALNQKNKASKGLRIALNVEFAAACALCGAIFLTNVFMPGSAINTFFRSMTTSTPAAVVDNRTYTDFTLSPVVSELSEAELSLSPTGILSFTAASCVYPAANGKVTDVIQEESGNYTVKVAHSDTFTGVISGLDYVYYAVGEDVKSNVPIGYTNGEDEVQVTLYSAGALLNCFELTEENCLAWVEAPLE